MRWTVYLVLILVVSALFVNPGAAAPDPQADFILVEKAARRLTLMHEGQAIRTYRIVLGGNPIGDKVNQGDDRTPEGRYVIDRKNPKSQFYLSLGVSYPDAADKADARRRGVKPGGDIFIHGTPDYIEPLYTVGVFPDWTRGCIALPNKDMEEVFKLVSTGTAIEIRP